MVNKINKNLNILISGGTKDSYNSNVLLRSYVSEAFEDVIGKNNVKNKDLESIIREDFHKNLDIFIIFGSVILDDINIINLRKFCDKSNSMMVFWLHDDPYEFDAARKIYQYADYIFSNDKWSSLHHDHPKSFYLPLAASKKHHYRPINNNFTNDIFFCGYAYQNRLDFINNIKDILSKFETFICGQNWDTKQKFSHNIRLDNSKLSKEYSLSKVVLNIGRDFNLANSFFNLPSSSPGPRTFEAAMAGCVQLYYSHSREILNFYNGNEIIFCDSIDSVKEKLLALLSDMALIKKISTNSQNKTIIEHTYHHRVQHLLERIL